jgi:hypothetical protein
MYRKFDAAVRSWCRAWRCSRQWTANASLMLKYLNGSVQAGVWQRRARAVVPRVPPRPRCCRRARRVFEFPTPLATSAPTSCSSPEYPVPDKSALSSIIRSKFLMRSTVFYIYPVFREIMSFKFDNGNISWFQIVGYSFLEGMLLRYCQTVLLF